MTMTKQEYLEKKPSALDIAIWNLNLNNKQVTKKRINKKK